MGEATGLRPGGSAVRELGRIRELLKARSAELLDAEATAKLLGCSKPTLHRFKATRRFWRRRESAASCAACQTHLLLVSLCLAPRPSLPAESIATALSLRSPGSPPGIWIGWTGSWCRQAPPA